LSFLVFSFKSNKTGKGWVYPEFNTYIFFDPKPNSKKILKILAVTRHEFFALICPKKGKPKKRKSAKKYTKVVTPSFPNTKNLKDKKIWEDF